LAHYHDTANVNALYEYANKHAPSTLARMSPDRTRTADVHESEAVWNTHAFRRSPHSALTR